MNKARNILLIFGYMATGFILPEAAAAVLSEEERAAVLEDGRSIINRQVRPVEAALLERISNPFAAAILNKPIEVVEKVITPDSAKEMLQLLAPFVKPTGVFSLGGSYIMMFKEKRVRAGSVLKVMYNEKEYELTVEDIQRSSYTLKFMDARLQIKLN